MWKMDTRLRNPRISRTESATRVCAALAPGIVFSLAVATVATGFPGWWEPMTNKHLRLHMIVACISAGNSILIRTWIIATDGHSM